MNTPEAHVLAGPRPVPTGWRRFVNLTLTLATTEFKLRYFGSVFGYLWTLAKPLMLFGVLYVAFTHIIRFGADVRFYPAYLLTAIVLWSYFSEATSQSVGSLVARETLVRKMPLPLVVIPLSISLTAFFNLLLNLIAVSVFVLVSGVEPSWSWLQFPLLVLGLVGFTAAVGSLVANLYVPFRDMKPIWEVVLQLGFWGTPIIYTIGAVPESAQRLMMMNPLAGLMTQMRHAVIDPTAPTAVEAAGGAAWLLIPAGIVVGVMALSLWLHRRITPQIAERL